MLVTPSLRKDEEEVEGEEQGEKGSSDRSRGSEDHTESEERDHPEDGSVAEQDDQDESKQPGRSCYNMACYGLPNLMITQLSKP